MNIHKETLARFEDDELTSPSKSRSPEAPSTERLPDGLEDVNGRCETVLNTTMAEFEVYHTAKRDAFERLTKAHLDSEIAFYEKVRWTPIPRCVSFLTDPELW